MQVVAPASSVMVSSSRATGLRRQKMCKRNIGILYSNCIHRAKSVGMELLIITL